jgi:GTPase SAR1 family protein
MMKLDTRMADALAQAGRGFGPGGQGAPPPIAAPTKPPPRAIRDGEVHLGQTNTGDAVGLSLGKLIEGRLLIQGNSGAGKSMLLRRLFEQSFGKVQQLLLDPDGEFSTLAEKFDVAVFTAADVLRVGGRAFAFHLREHRYSAVLDLSDATSEERLSTVADLATGLIECPAEHWYPLLVLVDEAQTFAPHYDTGDVDTVTRKRAIASLSDMMGRGRKRGVAGVIATQRLAETSKAVASKATNIIVGRTIFDRDLERSGALLGFTAGHSRALRTLADGEFLGLGPAFNAPGRSRFKAGSVQSRHKGDAPGVEAPPAMSAADTAALLLEVQSTPLSGTPRSVDTHNRSKTGRRGRDWKPEEDQIIRDGYANGTKIAEIGAQLAAIGYSTSVSNISGRANALGLSSDKAAVAYCDREDEIIREAYVREVKIMDIVGLLTAEGFNRGRTAIQMRAINLGITRDRVNYWTDAEKAIAIAGLTDGTSYREIIANLRAAGFERGVTSILKFAQKNNFSRAVDSWTIDEIAELTRLYSLKTPVKEIAEALGKPIGGIRAKASNLNLKQRIAWSEAEYELLRAASEDGVSLTDSAQRLGRPYVNVARVAATLKLSFKANRKAAAVAGKADIDPNTIDQEEE